MQYKILGLLLFSMILLACSPVYKTVRDYIPPQTKEGLSCLKNCKNEQIKCNQQCKVSYRTCSAKAEKEATLIFPELQEEYKKELDKWEEKNRIYENENKLYEREKHLLKKERDLYEKECESNPRNKLECEKVKKIEFKIFNLESPSEVPSRPTRPTLMSETKRLQNKNCTLNCSCESQYDVCYSSCGGTVINQKVCVENCD